MDYSGKFLENIESLSKFYEKVESLRLNANDTITLQVLASCHRSLLELAREKRISMEEITDDMIIEFIKDKK